MTASIHTHHLFHHFSTSLFVHCIPTNLIILIIVLSRPTGAGHLIKDTEDRARPQNMSCRLIETDFGENQHSL